MASKVKAATVAGIRVRIDSAALDDFEVVEAIADATDAELDDAAKMRAVVKLFRIVFGGDYARVKRELREANGGSLSVSGMMDFFVMSLEAVGSKN